MTQDLTTNNGSTEVDATYPKATTHHFAILRTGHVEPYNNRVVDPTTSKTVDLSELLQTALTDVVQTGEPQGNFLLKLQLVVTVLDYNPLEESNQTVDLAILPSGVTE